MIKYNWEKIAKASKYDPARIMLIIHMLTYPRLPKNFKDPTMKYQGQSFEGFSFLLNPEKLLANRKKYGKNQIILRRNNTIRKKYHKYAN